MEGFGTYSRLSKMYAVNIAEALPTNAPSTSLDYEPDPDPDDDSDGSGFGSGQSPETTGEFISEQFWCPAACLSESEVKATTCGNLIAH